MRLQNVLRSYGIESKLEQRFNIRSKFRCERHGPINSDETPVEIDGVLCARCPKCNRISPIMTYSADQWIEELNLIIEQDGKAHKKKQLSRDERRDQYLKSEYGLKIWRVSSKTSPYEIAEAVNLMLSFQGVSNEGASRTS